MIIVASAEYCEINENKYDHTFFTYENKNNTR